MTDATTEAWIREAAEKLGGMQKELEAMRFALRGLPCKKHEDDIDEVKTKITLARGVLLGIVALGSLLGSGISLAASWALNHW